MSELLGGLEEVDAGKGGIRNTFNNKEVKKNK